MKQWRQVAACLLGDYYYPLTAYNTQNDQWIAWQFDRPDLREGVVQAFRREDSIFVSACFKLHGLDPEAYYRITDLDCPHKKMVMSGKELQTAGLPVTMEHAPQANIFVYCKSK